MGDLLGRMYGSLVTKGRNHGTIHPDDLSLARMSKKAATRANLQTW